MTPTNMKKTSKERARQREKRPVIALPEHVHCVTAKGKSYYYFQPGRGSRCPGERVRLPNDPRDPKFWETYYQLTGSVPEVPKHQPFTFSALISEYKASPDFGRHTARTKIEYLRHLDTIERIWGDRLVRGVRAKHALKLRDTFCETPTKADHIVSMLSTIIKWGIPREYAETNPCSEIGDLSDSDGYAPWDWDDIMYAEATLPTHLWQVAAVALYTGQRQSDVLAMARSHVKFGEILVKQAKTSKSLWIPIHRDLAPLIVALPLVSTKLLTNSRGLPWGSGFKASWQAAMNKEAFAPFRERRLVFHGLRKSAVVMLLEAGCTDAEVAAITGQSRDMVEHYSRMVNQRKLARAAILKWEMQERVGNTKM